MRGKEEKKGRGNEKKKRRKWENKSGIKSQKKNKKKKKKSVRIFFLCTVIIFGPVRNTLFRVKQFISTFVFVQDIIAKQIR